MAFRKQKNDNKLDEPMDVEDEISIDDSGEDCDEQQIKPRRGTKKRFNKPSNFILDMLDKIDANILLSIILAPVSLIYNFLFAISSTYSLKQVYKVVLFNNIISFIISLIVHKAHLCFSVAVGSVAFLAFNYFVNDSIEHADAVSDTLVSFRRLSINELMMGLRNILPFMKVKDDEEKEIIKQLDDGSYEGDVDDEFKSLDEEVLDELIPAKASRQKASQQNKPTTNKQSKGKENSVDAEDDREGLSTKTSSLQKSLNEMNVDDGVLDTPSQDDIIKQMDKIPNTPVSTGIEIGGVIPKTTNQVLPQAPLPNPSVPGQNIRSSSMPMQPLSPGVAGIPQQPNMLQQPPLSAGKPQGIPMTGGNGRATRQLSRQTAETPPREIDKLRDFKSTRSPAQGGGISLKPTNNTSNTGGVMSADDSRDGLSNDYRM